MVRVRRKRDREKAMEKGVRKRETGRREWKVENKYERDSRGKKKTILNVSH